MSFGERAALEGVLGQLRPRLSVEIGTYDGGSLGPIAARSGHVHTIDLDDLVPDRERFANVTFHVGDSREVLPGLLADLQERGRPVDFAIVDGDHSAEGVAADLTALLRSSAVAETVILMHDTMNPGVRAGIEQARVEDHERVIYFEPDFVAGYEFRGGHFDGQVWGGLGLIVSGPERPSGYQASTRQTRYVEAFDGRAQTARLAAEVEALRGRLARELEARRSLEASVSWRVTAPLRSAKRRLGR